MGTGIIGARLWARSWTRGFCKDHGLLDQRAVVAKSDSDTICLLKLSAQFRVAEIRILLFVEKKLTDYWGRGIAHAQTNSYEIGDLPCTYKLRQYIQQSACHCQPWCHTNRSLSTAIQRQAV